MKYRTEFLNCSENLKDGLSNDIYGGNPLTPNSLFVFRKNKMLHNLVRAFGYLIFIFHPVLSLAAGDDYQIDVYRPTSTFTGTTLFADNTNRKSPKIVEVDMQGNILWSYSPPNSLFPIRRTGQNVVSDIERLANGNTVFNIQKVGIFEVNRTGEIIWRLDDNKASHDVDRLSNGNTIYVRGWEGKGGKHVIELDPLGEEVWSWDAIPAYDRHPYIGVENQGWIHVNAITRLSNGNTLISLRNFNTIAEITQDGDVLRETVFPRKKMPAEKRVHLKAHPHDPEHQPNGNILVAITGINLVLEVSPSGGPPVWKWQHPTGKRPAEGVRDANRLPNGNTLIVESSAINEITADGELVWRLRVANIGRQKKVLYKAQRISPDGIAYGH